MAESLTVRAPVEFERIVNEVCTFFNVTRADLVSGKRQAYAAGARHLIMYLARKHTGLAYEEIGYRLGHRHHSTAIHGVKVTERRLATEEPYRRQVDFIEIACVRELSIER